MLAPGTGHGDWTLWDSERRATTYLTACSPSPSASWTAASSRLPASSAVRWHWQHRQCGCHWQQQFGRAIQCLLTDVWWNNSVCSQFNRTLLFPLATCCQFNRKLICCQFNRTLLFPLVTGVWWNNSVCCQFNKANKYRKTFRPHHLNIPEERCPMFGVKHTAQQEWFIQS